MRVETENMMRMRAEEDSLYDRSLQWCLERQDTGAALRALQTALNLLHDVVKLHEAAGQDEKTLQYLGARAFNDSVVAFRLLLSGFYQTSFAVQRDLIELQFLLDWFGRHGEDIVVWRGASTEQRLKRFHPGALKRKLDCEDKTLGENLNRDKFYRVFCEYATHPTYAGMSLITKSDDERRLVKVGPFFDEHKLASSLFQLAQLTVFVVSTLHPQLSLDERFLLAVGEFLRRTNAFLDSSKPSKH